jgi:polysaccharide export outer membrane protein
MKIPIIGVFCLTTALCFGQTLRTPAPAPGDFSSNKPSNGPTSADGSDYRIGSDDLLDIDVFDIMELSAQPRVTGSGMISLKMVGTLQAGGLTPQELERVIEKVLKGKELVNDPHVTVTVREYASQPVSILGAVRQPAVYQIKGQKTLSSMISQAGGLDMSTVGSTIQVSRAPKDPASPRESIAIDAADFQRGNPALDIPIYANDTIFVQTAESVFVLGEVAHPDEFVLRNGVNLTVLKALAKGGGPTREAKKKDAIIIRIHQDRTRQEIPVDLDKIAQGKADDMEMMPNDILFVPASKTKAIFNQSITNAIGVVSGRLIYR